MGDIVPRNQPLFYDVPKRMAVDIAFQNINYSVQGEKGTITSFAIYNGFVLRKI